MEIECGRGGASGELGNSQGHRRAQRKSQAFRLDQNGGPNPGQHRWVCQVFCVNDLDFVLGFGFVVALGFAVVVGFGDGVQGKGAFPLPLHIHVEENRRLHYANLPGLVMRSGHRTVK
jgi:hypothetical protein